MTENRKIASLTPPISLRVLPNYSHKVRGTEEICMTLAPIFISYKTLTVTANTLATQLGGRSRAVKVGTTPALILIKQ